jgi:hypothetical protein
MRTLTNMVNSLKQLNTSEVITQTLEENSQKLVQANQHQLLSSLTAKGNAITPEYSLTNQKKKGFKNPNLLDTGKFQREITATVKGKEVEFTSTDYKTEKLTTKYGEDIFGLTDESKTSLKPINQKKAVEIVKQKLGL